MPPTRTTCVYTRDLALRLYTYASARGTKNHKRDVYGKQELFVRACVCFFAASRAKIRREPCGAAGPNLSGTCLIWGGARAAAAGAAREFMRPTCRAPFYERDRAPHCVRVLYRGLALYMYAVAEVSAVFHLVFRVFFLLIFTSDVLERCFALLGCAL